MCIPYAKTLYYISMTYGSLKTLRVKSLNFILRMYIAAASYASVETVMADKSANNQIVAQLLHILAPYNSENK